MENMLALTLKYVNKNSSEYKYSALIPELDNYDTVLCHGTENSNTGSKQNGFAQKLAEFLNVEVIAPTEAIWVNSYGHLFITDNEVIAEMWYSGEKVQETGEWRTFKPKKGGTDI